jgi:hypothetical protein
MRILASTPSNTVWGQAQERHDTNAVIHKLRKVQKAKATPLKAINVEKQTDLPQKSSVSELLDLVREAKSARVAGTALKHRFQHYFESTLQLQQDFSLATPNKLRIGHDGYPRRD